MGILFPTIQMQAQQIIIDKPVKAGELTLFPEMGNENVYYYLPDKLRLATDENGKPQFSFMKYVENVRSAPGEKDIREGLGGGIVHFVISLSVTPDQLSEAKNELRRIDPEGVIKGPVIYSGGTVSVISSFANTKGDLTKQVVGIGNAPLIDGEKAAVSMELTKKGAKILWESFKTPTPDISFSFEMELKGFRAPKKAIIEADFDKIYKHHSFDVGATGNYGKIMFGGEIELAFDELRRSGAIKITSMGSDADMDKLIETAYNKLTTMIFIPVGMGNPLVESMMKKATGNKSALERATELYNREAKKSTPTKTSPAKKKASIFAPGYFNDRYLLAGLGDYFTPGYSLQLFANEWNPKHIKEVLKDFVQLLFISDEEKNEIYKKIDDGEYIIPYDIQKAYDKSLSHEKIAFFRQYLLSDEEKKKYSDIINGNKDQDENFINLIKGRVAAIINHQGFLNNKQKSYILGIDVPYTEFPWDLSLSLTYLAWVNKDSIKYMPQTESYRKKAIKVYELRDVLDADYSEIEKQIQELIADTLADSKNNNDKKLVKQPSDTLKPNGHSNKPGKVKPAGGTGAAGASAANAQKKKGKGKKKSAVKDKDKKKTDFKMAVMATYQFKKVRQSGYFKIKLNKYTADKLLLRFDENIGQVKCKDCFKEVNLDDPMFKQREIVAILDGFNYDDFGKYINYVDLKMKKTHQNGDVTVDEVRIDRENFTKSANNFKLMYGWKGDNDRTKWFDYEIQEQWSFFGGSEVSSDWKKVNTNIVNLASPYVRRTIELESDPDLLKENKVRMVSVKIYYDVDGKEQVKQVALLPYKDQYSGTVDILLPNNDLKYDYEISWRMYGNKSKSSGRLTTSEPILFVDEL